MNMSSLAMHADWTTLLHATEQAPLRLAAHQPAVLSHELGARRSSAEPHPETITRRLSGDGCLVRSKLSRPSVSDWASVPASW
eukprot:42596-Prymnesium_polylepis.2